MEIYLPIAEISMNIVLLLGLGLVVGFLSGMFGTGGGFLMTPLLIFIGVPPPVAVATEANQITAASVSGFLAHWRRGNVDLRMGAVLVVSGIVGSGMGVLLFRKLRQIGQIDEFISILFVVFLGAVGILMAVESGRSIIRRWKGRSPGRMHTHYWVHGLPFKMRFRKSKLYISVLVPAGIGLFVGVLSAVMGVGGGFIMIPAMIYILGMPTSIVVGTSLFQIIFVTANSTLLHAGTNQTVDIVLALVLLLGAVVGAQFGSRLGARLRGEELRILLAILVLLVCAKLAHDLLVAPLDPYSTSLVFG
ncbi:MAG: permease [Rhodospirillaceae bacterium]|nr:permease [Rhodospirillaceae bacterium]|tara:strand:+ start:378 stop:1292 length:915 start_codon:yes stop_codon:yes gene_type:complete